MLSAEDNKAYTSVGPSTPMGEVLRRYWHPIAASAEIGPRQIKPVRLLGEDLVLFRATDGECGLLQRHCTHRRADLAFGFVDGSGLRCSYHGWCFGPDGSCRAQPFEDVRGPSPRFRELARAVSYPALEHAGLIWAYLGPQPAPLLPNWEPFSYPDAFAQVVFSDVPCNWLQCQENSIDPVHFEWQHSNWLLAQREDYDYGPTHERIGFFEFEFGLGYRRILRGEDESSRNWNSIRLCLMPNIFVPLNHFEWRVPVDDERTLSVIWHYTRVPIESEPYRQPRVPYWTSPTVNDGGRVIATHVINQDIVAWVGQGVVADRTQELLGRSDQGVQRFRSSLRAAMDAVAAGRDPVGVIRGSAATRVSEVISLPGDRQDPRLTRREWLAAVRALHAQRERTMPADIFWLAYGQPSEVFNEFVDAMGIDRAEIMAATGCAPRGADGSGCSIVASGATP